MKLKNLFTRRFLFRAWVMFRVGYGTYLTYPFALLGTLVSIYYLMIENVPVLKSIFPSFMRFSIAAVIIGLPLGVGIGYLHYKRSRAFSSEQDISVEANPYNYLPVSGKELDLAIPATLLGIDAQIALLRSTGALTPRLEERYHQLRGAYEALRCRVDMRKHPESYKLDW